MLYTNPSWDKIVPSYVEAHWLKKGRGRQLLANRSLSAPSVPPVRPSYWLFSVATTSLHISNNNIAWCTVWLEKPPPILLFLKSPKCYWANKFQHNLSFAMIRSWVDIVGGGKHYLLCLHSRKKKNSLVKINLIGPNKF